MPKFFMHAFIKGTNIDPYTPAPDAIGCYEIDKWEIFPMGIKVRIPDAWPREFWLFNTFLSGNRFYIVENTGKCQEPNGSIIWRNEDGNSGDEKAAA